MSQLSLFPTDGPKPAKYELILAVFPDEHTAQDIYQLGDKLRRKHRLIGRVRPLNHLHTSLPCFTNVPHGLDQVINLVDHACRGIAEATPPFDVTFDRVLSFKRRTLKQPLVLAGSKNGNAELKAFHRLLVAKLSGRSNANHQFTPHVTLLYDRQIDEEPINPVVSWKVNEVILVLSHVGATKYDRLGCWKLGG